MENLDTYTSYKEGLFHDKETIYDADTNEPLTVTVFRKNGEVVSVKPATERQKRQAQENITSISFALEKLYRGDFEEVPVKLNQSNKEPENDGLEFIEIPDYSKESVIDLDKEIFKANEVSEGMIRR